MPGFILQMRVTTASIGLMQPGCRTLPIALWAEGDIVVEAGSRIGQHLQVGVAVNRRRVVPFRVGEADKDVVVVFNRGRRRGMIVWVLDFQGNMVVGIDDIFLEDRRPILGNHDQNCSITGATE